MINLATATSYDTKTARNNVILLGQMILLFWNLKFKYRLVSKIILTAFSHYDIWRCFRYVFPLCLIKVGAMLEGMWIFREERNTVSCLMQLVCDTYVTRTFLLENGDWNREIIRQSLYVEYIGHKNMSLFSFCLGIFKQLAFSNVSLGLICFPPKAKYLFIRGIWKKWYP